MKKVLSLALALAMCLGLTVPSLAASSDFVIEDGTLKKYTGPGGAVTIPDDVIVINEGAFMSNSSLTSVTIPSSVMEIGNAAFYGCTNLTSVTIPSSTFVIGGLAFDRTPWLESQGEFAVVNDTLIRYQGSGSTATIPSNVNIIGKGAFYGCTSLTSIVIPDHVFNIEESAFSGCTNLASITIPPDFMFNIGAYAFDGCKSLTSVTIPSGVTFIGSGAFASCDSLTKISIPSSITDIGPDAFLLCKSLTDIYYDGSEAQWNAIRGDFMKRLPNTTIHFESGTGTQPTTPVEPEKPAEVKTANPSSDKLTVNGAEGTPTVYNIDNNNYFKIRDVAALLNGTEKQFSVGYDGEKQSVTATTGQGYDKLPTDLTGAPAGAGEAKASGDAIYVNGAKITPEVYNINGNNYFKLRDLGQALDFYIGWSLERGVYIETDKPYAG